MNHNIETLSDIIVRVFKEKKKGKPYLTNKEIKEAALQVEQAYNMTPSLNPDFPVLPPIKQQ